MEPNKQPPMRIDPQAAAILNSSCRAIDAILAKRASLDSEGKAHLPLFVHMGEMHDRPSHVLHHVSVTKGLLAAKQQVAFATELPYDFLAKEYCAYAGVAPRENVMTGLYLRDASGEYARRYIFSSGHTHADYATHLLQDYLLNSKIATRLTDSPNIPVPGMTHRYIDPLDGCNRKSMEACGKDALDLYSVVSASGVQIRNRHMMVHSVDLAVQSRARIILQQCGQAHVLGIDGRYPLEQSLAAQFRQKGIPAISLLLDGGFRANIASEEEYKEKGYDVLISTDLPNENFPCPAGEPAGAEEIKYTDRLLLSTGLRRDFGDPAEIEKHRQSCQRETEKLFSEWDKEFGLASAYGERQKELAHNANAIHRLLTAPGAKP